MLGREEDDDVFFRWFVDFFVEGMNIAYHHHIQSDLFIPSGGWCNIISFGHLNLHSVGEICRRWDPFKFKPTEVLPYLEDHPN